MNQRCEKYVRSGLLLAIVTRAPVLLGQLALLAVVAATGTANADEPTGEPPILTASEFLSKIERASPALNLLEGDVDLASANVTAAGLRSNPSIAFQREETFGGAGPLPENTLLVDLPLEISGRRALRVEAAELGVDAARQTGAWQRQAILLDALGVYLKAASARLTLDVLLAERVALKRLVDAVESRAAAGDASGYDLDRLAMEASALDELVADAELELLANRRTLAMLAGDPASRFDAGDTLALPSPVGGASPTASAATHPARRAAALRVQQADTELRAAGRGRVPGLSVSGGAKSAVDDGATRWGYVAGVSLSVPLWDHGQADADRARARLRSARAEQRLVEQRVLAQTGSGSEVLARLVERARHYEATQLPRLDRLVRRAETSFAEGEAPVFELLDAYRTARAGRLRAVELRLQSRLAELEVWRARGLGPGGDS